MVYTFVQQENPVFCFICREKISPICLGPETKFSREFQHKSYLNPKLVIVTKTNRTELYLEERKFIDNVVLKVQVQLMLNLRTVTAGASNTHLIEALNQ